MVSSNSGTLVKTNTNNFEGFAFRRNSSTRNLQGVYLEEKLIPSLSTSDWQTVSSSSPLLENVVLTTERKTDILIVKPQKWPIWFLDAKDNEKQKVKTAWLSLAEILGKAIVYREDIESNEIDVGIRYQPNF